MASRSAAKSLLSCTGIFESSAAGECIPPHWQLPTAATSADREKVRLDFFWHFRKTPGRFGWLEKREFPATIGLNEKEGMNDIEFEKYVENNLLHLFPDVIDEPGKRVCLKVDNSPGCNGRSLLLKMRFKGWYMYPGLPNATSVQQETDINYGPFRPPSG